MKGGIRSRVRARARIKNQGLFTIVTSLSELKLSESNALENDYIFRLKILPPVSIHFFKLKALSNSLSL